MFNLKKKGLFKVFLLFSLVLSSLPNVLGANLGRAFDKSVNTMGNIVSAIIETSGTWVANNPDTFIRIAGCIFVFLTFTVLEIGFHKAWGDNEYWPRLRMGIRVFLILGVLAFLGWSYSTGSGFIQEIGNFITGSFVPFLVWVITVGLLLIITFRFIPANSWWGLMGRFITIGLTVLATFVFMNYINPMILFIPWKKIIGDDKWK